MKNVTKYGLDYPQQVPWQSVASLFYIVINICDYLISVVETVIHKPGDE